MSRYFAGTMHHVLLLVHVTMICLRMSRGFLRPHSPAPRRVASLHGAAGDSYSILKRLLRNPMCADHYKWITEAVKITQEQVRGRSAVSSAEQHDCETQYFFARPGLNQAIVDTFVKRQNKRSKNPHFMWDKGYNPLTAVCGPRGSGRSAVLANLHTSEEYQKYASAGSIVVHFDQSMGGYKFLADRILFSALVSVGVLRGDDVSWEAFASTASCRNRSYLQLENVIQAVVGKGARCLLCIDDLTSRTEPEKLLNELCNVLSCDEFTDVVVSSNTASTDCFHTMLSDISESARRVHYLPLASFPVVHRLAAFETAVDQHLSRRRPKTHVDSAQFAGKFYKLKNRLLLAAPILSSGHAGTVAAVLASIRAPGAQWQPVQAMLEDPDCNAGTFMRTLCNLPCFTESFPDATTDKQRDFILSADNMQRSYPGARPVLRAMTKAGKCDLVPTHLRYFWPVRVSTNLAALFRMADHCAAKKDKNLGAKSQFLKILFGGYYDVGDFAALWVRARALALAIQGYEDTRHNSIPFRCTGNVTVRFAQPGDKLAWERDAVVVAKEPRAGWDILACYTQTIYENYEDDIIGWDQGYPVGFHRMYLLETALLTLPAADEELVDLVAHRVMAAVDQCFAAEEGDGEDHGDLFWRVTVLFSVYEDVDLSQICSEEALLNRMEALLVAAGKSGEGEADVARWQRAIVHVQAGYGHKLRFVGKQELEAGMPKVLLPIAELVKAVA